jgi:hypothetical protein
VTVRVEIDEAAVAEMALDWAGPIGQIIERLTTEVHENARAMAPVSDRGSKWAPPARACRHSVVRRFALPVSVHPLGFRHAASAESVV